MQTLENTTIGDNVIRSINPVNAISAAPKCSSRYGFISTSDVVTAFGEAGFTPRSIQLARVVKEEKRGYQKHLIRFQHESLKLKVGGDSLPEVILFNSHDGTTAARLSLGLFRLVCSNGMVVGKSFEEYRVSHRASGVGNFIQAAHRILEQVPILTDRVIRYQQQTMSDAAIEDFSVKALQLRYDQPAEDASLDDVYEWRNRLAHISCIRRYDDAAPNLWSVFNRIQENLINPRRGSDMRRVTAPFTDVKINKELWDIAETYLN